jgi:hypothetical protein
MNTTKSVYNRLFAEDKVELASERVELATVIDNVRNAVGNVQNLNSNAYNEMKKAVPTLDGAIKQFNMVLPSIDRAIKVLIKAEDMAKDLGIPLPPEYAAIKKRLYDEEEVQKKAVDNIQAAIKQLQF